MSSLMRRIMPCLVIAGLASVPRARADIQEILERFHDPTSTYVLVAAHRGGYLSDTGNALPENSLPAMERSISLGVEILEIDLQMTSDGQLVILHDGSVDRTTNGTGSVSSKTLAQIKALRLLGPGGAVSDEQVPTFREVMDLVKGRAMVNLDKLNVANATTMNAAMQVMRDTDTVDHAIFKGSGSVASVQTALNSYPEDLAYMPVLNDSSAATVISYLQALTPPAVELSFTSGDPPSLAPGVIETARQTGTRIWINSLWASLNGGHHDSIAIGGNPDASWGWILDKGATIIQTDYPERLIAYLQSLGRRGTPATPVHSVVYDFKDGLLEGWVNVRTSSVHATHFISDAGTYENRTPAALGDFKIVHTPFLDGRDRFHQSLVLRSPAFPLHGLGTFQTLEFSLLGGAGSASSAPATDAAVPVNAGPDGFLGVALRRVSDGRYLASAKRSSNAQGQSWQRIRWTAAQLTGWTGSDAPGETYTLDLIDSFGPAQNGGSASWGWIALDAVSVPWTGQGDPKLPTVHHFDLPGMWIEWNSYPGYYYRVQRSTDLGPESWRPASGTLPATPPLNRFTIPVDSSHPDREFFRVERQDGAD